MLFLLVVSYVLVELMASLDSFCSLKLLEDKNSLEETEGRPYWGFQHPHERKWMGKYQYLHSHNQ